MCVRGLWKSLSDGMRFHILVINYGCTALGRFSGLGEYHRIDFESFISPTFYVFLDINLTMMTPSTPMHYF